MKWESGINLILGLWLVVSPWMLGFTGTVAATSTAFFGALILIASLIELIGTTPLVGLSWANGIFGLWTLFSPWMLGFSVQIRQEPLQVIAIVMVTVVGVGRGNHVRDAVGGGHAAHGGANVPGFGTVMYFGKNANEYHHNMRNTLAFRGYAPELINRCAGKEKAELRRRECSCF